MPTETELHLNEWLILKAVHELVATEKQYSGDVTNLISIFSDPMRKLDIISAELQSALFSNLPELEAMHKGILAEMI